MSMEHHLATCATCGGPCSEKQFAGRYTGTWLHLRSEDWADDPHEAAPVNDAGDPEPTWNRLTACPHCGRDSDATLGDPCPWCGQPKQRRPGAFR